MEQATAPGSDAGPAEPKGDEHSSPATSRFEPYQRPIRAAVVGTGGISMEHLGFLAGHSQIAKASNDGAGPNVRLVGVCDLSPVASAYARREFDADGAFTDIETMLDEAKPDVVHVLTPPASHTGLVRLCLEHGCHVICEKPITTSAAELSDLLTVAEQAERRLTESHNYRFNQSVQTIAANLRRGTFGELREVELRIALPVTDPESRFGDPNLPSPIHQLPAGVLHDFTTHFGYLLNFLAPETNFDRISAAWSNHAGNDWFRYDNLDALLIGQGPQGPVHARLRFDAGAGPDTFTIIARGSQGWVETDLFQPYMRSVQPRPGGSQLSPIVNHLANGVGLVRDGIANVARKVMQQSPYAGLHQMLAETYDALEQGRPLPVSPEDMMAASVLVDRILAEEVRL